MASAGDEIDSAPIIDTRAISNHLGYAVGSIRRHKRLVVILFAAIFGATVSALFLLPKSYRVETKLLAQRNLALALKGDNQGEAPSRAAVETVKQRDNLVAIIRKTDLLHEWYAHRAPLPRLKDLLVKLLTKPETEQETVDWMADVLEKRMTVWTPAEGIIQMSIDWPDPAMAMRLMDTAQQNYLDSRHATEVTAIGEQVAILQSHAGALRADIDTAVDAIEKMRAERLARPLPAAAAASTSAASPSLPTSPAQAASPAPRRAAEPDAEVAQLKAAIDAKQRAMAELEEFRRRRLSELNASLAEKRATYTDNHPTIIDLKQTIQSLSTESPQVQVLRTDIANLQKTLDAKTAGVAVDARTLSAVGAGRSAAPPPLPGSIIRIEQEPSDDRDPGLMYARTRLRDAMDKYSTLRTQIQMAQIDFETAEAAFKYRYSVIDPPLYPKKPDKPNAALVIVAGLVGALLVAIFAAIAVDIRRGRFVERWQIERALDLPMLAEVDLATLAQHELE